MNYEGLEVGEYLNSVSSFNSDSDQGDDDFKFGRQKVT